MAGYIGLAPVPQATQTREAFTATSSQTSFATAGYTPGYLDVYLNGVKLAAADYTATNGSDVVLASGATSGDILEVVAFELFEVANLSAITGDFVVDSPTFVVDSSNNRVGVGTTSPATALDVVGNATITVADNSTNLTLVSTDADASVGPVLDLYRNSASPADNDVTGRIIFSAENDADEKTEYTKIITYMPDVSNGSEDAAIQYYLLKDGTSIQRLEHSPTETVFNQDSADVDFRVESNGNANMLFVDGGNDAISIGTNSPSTFSNYTNVTLQGGSAGVNLDFKDSGGNRTHAIVSTPSEFIVETGNTDPLIFKTNNTEAARFDSSQNLLVGTTTEGHAQADNLTVAGSGHTGITIRSTDSNETAIFFSDATSGTGEYIGAINYIHSDNSMRFAANVNERMRIDSSGNLLVGKTTIATGTAGVALRSNGEVRGTVSGAEAARFSRLSSDGAIIGFEKDGSGVGSIGTSNGGDLYIGNDDTGLLFAGGSDMVIPWNPSGPSSRDNAISIGSSSNRFEHLFLSGNVTANALVHDGDDNTFIHFPSADTLAVNTGGSESMRIDSSGNLLVGATAAFTDGSVNSGGTAGLCIATGSGNAGCLNLKLAGGNGTVARFIRGGQPNGGVVGSISITTSATAYNTSSDYRLKENVANLTGATTRLKQLEPKRFNFIADADTTVDGFLAHEVQTIVPEAITGTHNQVDDDGNPVYQGIDQSKLVPLLVATIKELEARITALEGA